MSSDVSLVIPCFNQAQFLAQAIESALPQTAGRPDIIVVDDGSTHNTVEVARRYAGVSYRRKDNQGLAAARNAGIREVQKRHVVFLDADDRLLPAALEVGLAQMAAHPDCTFTAGAHRFIGVDGTILAESPSWRVEGEPY